jgi:hypothetical protein
VDCLTKNIKEIKIFVKHQIDISKISANFWPFLNPMNLFNIALTPHFGRVRKRLQLINIYPNHEVIITT